MARDRRRSALTGKSPGANIFSAVTYSYYAPADRLYSVSELGGLYATYTYETNSDRVTTAVCGSNVFTIQKLYDTSVERLTTVNNRLGGTGGAIATSHLYGYDSQHRRTTNTNEDGTHWSYTYNDRSEVANAKRVIGSGQTVLGWDSSYNYDNIGNRDPDGTGGSTPGMLDDGLITSYNSNNLNQYTTIVNPTSFHLKGKYATGTPTVAVDSVSQTVTTQFPYFKATAATSNMTYPDWQLCTVTSSGDSYSAYRYNPTQTETLTYDADGNLTSDARWIYTWDLENRLIKMQTTSGAISGGVPNYTLEFTYDAYGRRVRKKLLIGTSTSSDEKFVYDGWNVIGKFYASTDNKHQSYLWGLDLSETPQGAGGVGGLLAVRDYSPSFQGDHYVGYDGNGNVNLL